MPAIMQWYKTEEKLPEVGQEVLTLWDGWNGCFNKPARHWLVAALCEDGSWYDGEGNDVDEPTHWMPLPEPPES